MKPVNLIGGQAFNGGAIREYLLPSNVAAAYFTGSVIYMNTNGVPTMIAATPTAGTTAGILGVMVGVRYTDPTLKYTVFGQYLPTGAYTAGYRAISIRVCDDPDQLYSIQAATVVGSKTNGARGAIGQNAPLSGFSGSTTTGLANTALDTGTNWATCASTTTLAMRIVDIITPDDAYPEVLVKFNQGVHSYLNPLGV
ncbi:MAG: hypothetical protein ACK559_20815 [bacterium]